MDQAQLWVVIFLLVSYVSHLIISYGSTNFNLDAIEGGGVGED